MHISEIFDEYNLILEKWYTDDKLYNRVFLFTICNAFIKMYYNNKLIRKIKYTDISFIFNIEFFHFNYNFDNTELKEYSENQIEYINKIKLSRISTKLKNKINNLIPSSAFLPVLVYNSDMTFINLNFKYNNDIFILDCISGNISIISENDTMYYINNTITTIISDIYTIEFLDITLLSTFTRNFIL